MTGLMLERYEYASFVHSFIECVELNVYSVNIQQTSGTFKQEKNNVNMINKCPDAVYGYGENNKSSNVMAPVCTGDHNHNLPYLYKNRIIAGKREPSEVYGTIYA